MDNSLLAVRDINHKYIVVDWSKVRKIGELDYSKDVIKDNDYYKKSKKKQLSILCYCFIFFD